MLAEAKREAERIVKEARERQAQPPSSRRSPKAERQAEDIIEDPPAREREIRLGAEDYADEILNTLEVNLSKFIAEVQRGRERLQGKDEPARSVTPCRGPPTGMLELADLSPPLRRRRRARRLSFTVGPGRCSGSSAPTAPARRPRCGSSSACSARPRRGAGRRPPGRPHRRALRLHARGARPLPEDARPRPARLPRPPARRRAQARAAADDWIERLGLDRAGGRPRRAALARQPAARAARRRARARPELLVLDEPFSGLDPVGVDVLSGVLRDYARSGVPVVFSSHQLELVERLCEAVAIIKDGRLVASGRRRGAPRARRRRCACASGARRRLARGAGAEVVDAAAACSSRCRRRVPTPCSTPPAPPAPSPTSRSSARRSPSCSARWCRHERRGRPSALVARREITERVRESRSCRHGVTSCIVARRAPPPSLGFGGNEEYTVGCRRRRPRRSSRPRRRAARRRRATTAG